MSGKCYIEATFCSLICIYPVLRDDFASDFLSLRQTQAAPLFAPTMQHTLAREGWAVPGQGVSSTGQGLLILAVLLWVYSAAAWEEAKMPSRMLWLPSPSLPGFSWSPQALPSR